MLLFEDYEAEIDRQIPDLLRSFVFILDPPCMKTDGAPRPVGRHPAGRPHSMATPCEDCQRPVNSLLRPSGQPVKKNAWKFQIFFS
jgi:hypothetical protein